eukprot:7289259-Pyramimonas_sp.AAC.1
MQSISICLHSESPQWRNAAPAGARQAGRWRNGTDGTRNADARSDCPARQAQSMKRRGAHTGNARQAAKLTPVA